MPLKDKWVDKINDVDYIDANDINEIAHSVIDMEHGLDEQQNNLNRRGINVAHLFTEELNEDNTSIQLYNAFKYCVDNGYMAYVPTGTYIVGKIKTSIDDAGALVIPNGCDVIFDKGVKFKLKAGSPSWTRTVVLHGDNNLYGHFEIDGSRDEITDGNEHMAGLFTYGRSNIYIESVYSHDCVGDNVQLSGDANKLGRNIIIDRLKCRNAGRKALVFEGSTNIHIKNAYLDNYGCLDIEPFGGDVECYYKIDRLETTGANDFTAGTTVEGASRYVIDIGTLIQHSGVFLSYSMSINIDTAIFYENVQINQTYASFVNINNAVFHSPTTKAIIDSRNNGISPTLNIRDLKVFGSGEVEESFTSALIISWGANISINNIDVRNVPVKLLYSYATEKSNIYFGNVYLENCGASGGYLAYLCGTETTNNNVVFENLTVVDERETPITRALFIITTSMINKVKLVNYTFTPNTIIPGDGAYGIKAVVHGNGGDTEYRPTNISRGYQYYDTTLNKPIWWTGSKWVDATGVDV